MKRFLFSLLIVTFTTISCAQHVSMEKYLTGVWYRDKEPGSTETEQFSWGKGKYIPNFSIVMEIDSQPPSILLPIIGGPFEVKNSKSISQNLYRITFFFDRGNFDVSYLVHVSGKDTIWFELDSDEEVDFIPTGEQNIWYKISGPK